MKRMKLEELLRVVNKELNLAKKRYEEVKEASDHMQKTAAGSWSAAGDREYAKGQEEINKFKLDALVLLKREIEQGLKQYGTDTVSPPCYIKYKYQEDCQEVYFVEHVVNISEYKLISNQSPLGEAIESKAQGDKFFYTMTTDGKNLSVKGEIIEIG
jgi:hypothetical protein